MDLSFAQNLKILRKEAQMTQVQLAEMVGVTQRKISSLEVGIVEPDIQMLKRVSKLFNVTIDYLLDNGD